MDFVEQSDETAFLLEKPGNFCKENDQCFIGYDGCFSIDVESMDLNFIELAVSTIIKSATDPYTEAIHERKLTLVARGLRNLPSHPC